MSSHVIKQVEPDDILCVSYNLENQHVPTMAEDECIRPTVLGIEFNIEVVSSVEDEFIRGGLPVFRIYRSIQFGVDNLYKAMQWRLRDILRKLGMSDVSQLRGRTDLLRYIGEEGGE